MKHLFILTLILITSMTTSCSPRWPHRYDTLAPRAPFHGFGKVVVLVRDNRAEVLNGLRNPQDVGTVESMGKTFPIEIATGHAFAQDVGVSVCNSLIGKGFECVPLVSGRSEIAEELDYIKETQAPVRTLFVTVEEWNVEVFVKTRVQYNFALKVFNANGETKASLNTAGEEQLGKVTTLNPAKAASRSAPAVLNNVLSSLLSHSQVISSMNMVRDIDVLGSRYK
ncbi:MAG: hypothetical protein ACOX2O_04710 [Bdellovibrionota bacterium]|jgi:hypothetical protein